MRDRAKAGHYKPRTDLMGEANPKGKLTENDVREIRRLYATGKFSQSQLGRMWRVAHSTIGRIIRQEYWGHVRKIQAAGIEVR